MFTKSINKDRFRQGWYVPQLALFAPFAFSRWKTADFSMILFEARQISTAAIDLVNFRPVKLLVSPRLKLGDK